MQPVEIVFRYAVDDPRAVEHPVDADAAQRRLDCGNRAFSGLFTGLLEGGASAATARRIIPVDPCDLGLGPHGAQAPAQRPFAAVLGCADARVPIELIFNEGPNELFVVRVAGNTLGDDVRGSLDYAIEHLGESLKLVVVLGHSGCGAVTAAVDVFLDPAAYLSLTSQTSVRNLVDRLQVVVQACARRMQAQLGPDVERHPRYRQILIEMSVVLNAALAAHTLQQAMDRERASTVRTAYGVYVLDDRSVWAPRCGSDEVQGLAAPPGDQGAFVELSDAVLRSQRIAALIGAWATAAAAADHR